MLRSLGSSLIAKASPGAALRKTQEARAEMPPVPQIGQTGATSRMGLEQPLERQVPAGSQKIVSIQPTIEGTQVAPGIIPGEVPAPIPGIGISPEKVIPSVPGGAENQALFQGGVGSPAGRVTNKPARTVSTAGGAKPAVAYQPKPEPTPAPETQGEQTQYQAPVAPATPGILGTISNILGGKAIGKESQPIQSKGGSLRTLGQMIAATAVGAGKGFGLLPYGAEIAQRINPNPISNALMSFASKPNTTQGSITAGLRSLGNQAQSGLRSLQNKIGSFFKR